ncbi:MAG TPA: methanogenesis marker 17 protein [Methanophagales archaeon]|nr:methanogenesis marker 17 protein [Methanophagales archaeon]
MEVKVEGGDDFANESYAKICLDTFRDVGLRGNIDHAYMYCNPTEHVFIIAAKIERVSSPVTVWDITLREGNKLRITVERYAPKLLALLWDKYGERVEQISRLEISLKLEDKEVEELMNLIVYDPREDLVARILSGMDRILPEGARVRSSIPSTDSIAIIASENPIGKEWKKKAEEIVSEHV